jgi:predicted house-cleaning NTP pyrophosphatase (Maf/HAM1 superfamily)
MSLVLGSQSQWRKKIIFEELGLNADLIDPNIDEKKFSKNEQDPRKYSMNIAHAKLQAVLPKCPKCLCMCFDSIVYYKNRILEKPSNQQENREMIDFWNEDNQEVFCFYFMFFW